MSDTISGPISNMTDRDRAAERLRAAALKWKRENDPRWRDKPWHDGILIDCDEWPPVFALVDAVLAVDDEADPDGLP